MTKDEVLKLALEALEGVLDDSPKVLDASISGGLYEVVQCRDAITAIKEALAQPAPVPIVHIVGEIDHTGKVWSPAAVPDALTHDEGWSAQYVAGWNNCRQAVLVKEQQRKEQS
jgi:hypothetical protein